MAAKFPILAAAKIEKASAKNGNAAARIEKRLQVFFQA